MKLNYVLFNIHDTTFIESIGSLTINPINGSVWMMDEFGTNIIVMESELMSNSIQEAELQDNRIQVYPNPTNQYLNINSTLLEDGHIEHIKIINAAGQIIRTIAPTTTINVDQLPQGVYWLQLQTKNKRFHQSFIKN